MLKSLVSSVLVVALGLSVASSHAVASRRSVTGRITIVSQDSLSVLDREVVTIKIDSRTQFTKMLTQKPWEEDVRLTAKALQPGRYVAVHLRPEDPTTAAWIQIATDLRPLVVAPSPLASQAASAVSSTGDLLSQKELLTLVANAKSKADHLKLAKHFAAEASKYDAEADEHAAMAKAYRARPNPSETKRPGAADTAMHCDRLVELSKSAAQVARDLSAAHTKMASEAK